MSVLRSIIRRVILEAAVGSKPTRADIALAYYTMSIAPSSVIKKILKDRSPILSYISVITDSAGNPDRTGSQNKIEMQMGVPFPDPTELEKIKSQLGSMSDLRAKVRKASQPGGPRPARIIGLIANANFDTDPLRPGLDERFFPKELVFELVSSMTSLGVVKSAVTTNVMPKETRDTIEGMKATLSSIKASYGTPAVLSALEEVYEKIDEFVQAFRQRKSAQVGRTAASDFRFTDVEEHEHDLDTRHGEVSLDTIYDQQDLSGRRGLPKNSRRMSLSEALLGPTMSDEDPGDEDDPYAFDIGVASAFDAPVDTIARSPEKAGAKQVGAPDEIDDEDDSEDLAQDLLGYLAELDDLNRSGADHTEDERGDLTASVHDLIDAMNEEDGKDAAEVSV